VLARSQVENMHVAGQAGFFNRNRATLTIGGRRGIELERWRLLTLSQFKSWEFAPCWATVLETLSFSVWVSWILC
jgi:hypothetical protein